MKTAPWHILNTHIKLVIKFYQVIGFDNILVIESTQEFHFLSEKRDNLISCLLFFQNLDSHYLIIRYKFSTIDFAK